MQWAWAGLQPGTASQSKYGCSAFLLDLRTLVQVTGGGPGNQPVPGSEPGGDKATEHQLQTPDTGVRKPLVPEKGLHPRPPTLLSPTRPARSSGQQALCGWLQEHLEKCHLAPSLWVTTVTLVILVAIIHVTDAKTELRERRHSPANARNIGQHMHLPRTTSLL